MVSVRRALSTARAVMSADCATWRLISVIDEDNSSAAAATVWTRVLASVAAVLTIVARWLVRSAVPVMDCAVVSSSVDPDAISPTSRPTDASNRSASAISAWRFSFSACCFAATCSASSVRAVIAVCRSISSVSAMRPISSPRSVSSTAWSSDPEAMRSIRFFCRSSAPRMSRAISQDSKAISAMTPAPIAPRRSRNAFASASRSST
jgi:hypothetical protein